MTMTPIYLDYNATAPLRPEAREAILEVWESAGNASSIHAFGRKARLVVEEARQEVARALGADAEEVIFTSGGTESNALALKGYARGAGSMLVSSTAHDSVLKNVLSASGEGKQGGACSISKAVAEPVILPVDGSGVLELSVLEDVLASAESVPFVSLEWVNSETGVVQPVGDVVAIARRFGAVVHVDAVQAPGRLALDGLRGEDRPDLVSVSAHKIGGSQGVGALIVRDGFMQRNDLPFMPLFGGGGQEKGRRSGTENVAGVAGFGAAMVAALSGLSEDVPRWGAWQEAFEQMVLTVEGAQIAGRGVARVANTSCLLCDGFKAETGLMRMDMAGFAVSSGSACSSGKVGVSHVLKAMGLAEDLQGSALRVSFGWSSTFEELQSCAEYWTKMVNSARS